VQTAVRKSAVFMPIENIINSANLGSYPLSHVLFLQYRGHE
jgi:hypothetical protein